MVILRKRCEVFLITQNTRGVTRAENTVVPHVSVGCKERMTIVDLGCGLSREKGKSPPPKAFTEGCAHLSLTVEGCRLKEVK